MPNSNRRRGDYFERRAKATLERETFVVVRAAGSLGPADLVALKQGCPPWLVSCKLGGYLRPLERQGLADAAARAGALPLMASSPKPGWLCLEIVSPFGLSEPQMLQMPPTRKKADA